LRSLGGTLSSDQAVGTQESAGISTAEYEKTSIVPSRAARERHAGKRMGRQENTKGRSANRQRQESNPSEGGKASLFDSFVETQVQRHSHPAPCACSDAVLCLTVLLRVFHRILPWVTCTLTPLAPQAPADIDFPLSDENLTKYRAARRALQQHVRTQAKQHDLKNERTKQDLRIKTAETQVGRAKHHRL